jgi:hypothetical protein
VRRSPAEEIVEFLSFSDTPCAGVKELQKVSRGNGSTSSDGWTTLAWRPAPVRNNTIRATTIFPGLPRTYSEERSTPH